jgi:hypothetical protein
MTGISATLAVTKLKLAAASKGRGAAGRTAVAAAGIQLFPVPRHQRQRARERLTGGPASSIYRKLKKYPVKERKQRLHAPARLGLHQRTWDSAVLTVNDGAEITITGLVDGR